MPWDAMKIRKITLSAFFLCARAKARHKATLGTQKCHSSESPISPPFGVSGGSSVMRRVGLGEVKITHDTTCDCVYSNVHVPFGKKYLGLSNEMHILLDLSPS